MTTRLADVLAQWRSDAEVLRRYGQSELAAALITQSDAIERALAAEQDELLSITHAAQESGYSADHLRREIGRGRIRNHGRKGAPRLRRGDLPLKPGTLRLYPVEPTLTGTSKGQIARSVVISKSRRHDD